MQHRAEVFYAADVLFLRECITTPVARPTGHPPSSPFPPGRARMSPDNRVLPVLRHGQLARARLSWKPDALPQVSFRRERVPEADTSDEERACITTSR